MENEKELFQKIPRSDLVYGLEAAMRKNCKLLFITENYYIANKKTIFKNVDPTMAQEEDIKIYTNSKVRLLSPEKLRIVSKGFFLKIKAYKSRHHALNAVGVL